MAEPQIKSVGHYDIQSPVGKGGMGEVFRARDKKLDRYVAIKFLSAEFSEDHDKLARFFQEARAASALNHPNIMTVFEIGEHEGSNYIVTELIEGRTLSDYVSEERPDLGRFLDIAVQIASALSAAHEAGIVHRDIKPGNIMIRDDRIVKVLDFGLAKLSNRGDESLDPEAETIAKVTTLPGMLMGTPAYMSPEQARSRELDSRTDLFSFGVVLYEMLTGNRPFTGETYADVMGAVLKDDPLPFAEYVDNIPSDVEQLVLKLLRKDRQERYQNTKDVLIDLKDIKDHLKFEEKLTHTTHSGKARFDSSADIHGTDAIDALETLVAEPVTGSFGVASIGKAAMFLVPLAAVAASVWWYAASGSTEVTGRPPADLKTTDIVSWNSAPGELSSVGRFSPDGKMIAFASTRPGSKDIWIKQTAEGGAIQVTKDKFNNKDPIWSANGNEIAYFSDKGNLSNNKRGNATGIWRIPTLGGNPVSVGAVEDGSSQLRFWSESGKIYYESNNNLYFVDVATGESKQVTNFDTEKNKSQFVSISKDETQVAFVRGDGTTSTITIEKLNGGGVVSSINMTTKIGALVWHPNNEELIYSGQIDGVYQIFSLRPGSENGVQLTYGERSNFVVDVAADGKSILAGSAKEESNLWSVKVAGNEENSVAASIDAELWPGVSSADGNVAFQSIKNLSQGNRLMSGSILALAPGSDQPPAKIVDNGYLPSWSPDGTKLAFMRLSGSNPEIWTVKSNGGQATRVATGGISQISYSVSPYNRVQTKDFDWSPDGNGIVYISDRNGSPNIWQSNSGGGNEISLTTNSSKDVYYYCPIWSDEGTKLAYYTKSRSTDDGGKSVYEFWTYDAATKASEKFYETSRISRLIGWSKPGSEVLIASSDTFSGLPPKVYLSHVNVESGTADEFASIEDAYYYNIHLSPDNKSIAFVSNIDGKDNLHVIPDGGKNARKITSNNDANLYFSSLSWSPDGKTIYFGRQTRFSLLSMITNFQQ